MLRQPKINFEDTNVAALGSDLDKKCRVAAAETEPAWANAGKSVGLEIWRIEKFTVKSWPKDQYGSFYSGDSYIVLNTYKKPDSDALAWDVHFWLGRDTTQDEYGTAAYKTVELDDLLGGGPVQHREVGCHESDLFRSYFPRLTLMEGGVESGFRHVKPEEYQPRLFHVKGKGKNIRVMQVITATSSLNAGDVFVLDLGMRLLQWNGSDSAPMERNKAAEVGRAICQERLGKAKLEVIDQGDEPDEFWVPLGGKADVKSAEEGGADDLGAGGSKKLFRLSDASGKTEFTEVTGGKLSRDLLDSKDAFVFDSGSTVYAWIGKDASENEKKQGIMFAQQYLSSNGRPAYTPITRIMDGNESPSFLAALAA